eukprot:gb/GFBE01028547.1/.p1 GENE.gb/GFBE01028547.1/~~gb/GFBE01028547.1/.p1  ORF type:complete len:478 (+),score=76.33 gb/GFBE01028547.1/:1-1434(+)
MALRPSPKFAGALCKGAGFHVQRRSCLADAAERRAPHWNRGAGSGCTRFLSAAPSAPSEDEVPLAATRGQLVRLGLVSAIPFVGFGFMDNVIMIVAGDAIDASIGVKLGVSTMAAAGLGNTLSDCVGLFTGDYIEGLCKKAGIREPKLTEQQLESREVKWTKSGSSLFGLAFGCLLGMFPLAIQTDRKPLYFSAEQEEIYESLFRPHGLSLQQFFDLIKGATWHDVEAGTVLAEEGKQLRSVFFLCDGSARATGKRVMLYRASRETEDDSDAEAVASGATLRGRVIGGSCLVDPKHKATDLPYPYEVRTTSRMRYIQWPTEKLQEIMDSNKAIESAILSILYADLAESTRRWKSASERSSTMASPDAKHDENYTRAMRDYRLILQVAIADDFVHPSERRLCHEFRQRRGLSARDHSIILEELGWTTTDWMCGSKDSREHAATRSAEDIRQRIPELLRSSGIPSRLVESANQGQSLRK